MIVYLTTGDLRLSESVHRTVTHGLLAIGIIFGLGTIISLTRKNLKWLFIFSLGFTFGFATHILYDLLDGYVAILAPFTYERYTLTGWSYQAVFGDTFYKVWTAFDCVSDVMAYLLLWGWATKKAMIASDLKFAKLLLIISFISIAFYGVMFVLAFTDISVDMHVLICYIYWSPIHVPLSTIFIHWKMRNTIEDFSFLNLLKS